MAESFETLSKEDLTLHFVFEGVKYSLSVMQNGETRAQLLSRAKFWLPDLIELDEQMVGRAPEPNGL